MEFKQFTDVQKEFWRYRGRLLCILGSPASGKSTFGLKAQEWFVSQQIEAKYFCENINKKFLEAYLKDPETLAASFQYTTAINRLHSYKEALNYCKTGGIAIMDGMLYSDPPFEQLNYDKGYISDSLHNIYEDIMSETTLLPPPDIIAFLGVNPETNIIRLYGRSTKVEISNYDLTFYEQMYKYNANTLKNVELQFIDYNKDVDPTDLQSHIVEIIRSIFRLENTRIGLPPMKKSAIMSTLERLPTSIKNYFNVYTEIRDDLVIYHSPLGPY